MAGSSYRPTQSQIDAWQKSRVSQEAEAQKATTLQELAKYFNGSQYARDIIKSANREAYNILSKIETSLVNRDPYRDMNQQVAKATMLLGGYTTKQADQVIAQDRANVRASRTQSAGIRAGGVQQNFNTPTFSTKVVTPTNAPDPLNFFNDPSTSTSMSTVKASSTDPATAQANADQTAYVNALRSGGVSIAEALLNPRTPQTYYVKGQQVPKSQTSINLETFLTERGYDITKPETIPDSVFKAEKQTEARAQARTQGTMGDLRNFANTYPKETQAVQQARQEIKDFFGVQPYQSPSPSSSIGGGRTIGLASIPAQQFFPQRNYSPTALMGTIDYSASRNLMPAQKISLESKPKVQVDQWGVPYTDPVSWFFGSVAKGTGRTLQSNYNLIENAGRFITGQEQKPLPISQTPVQDFFFGAVTESVKTGNTKPLDDFFGTQSKRNPVEVGSELLTEGLLWAIPVSPAVKGATTVFKFFSPSAKAVRSITPSSKTKSIANEFSKDTAKPTAKDQISTFFKTSSKGSKRKAEIVPQAKTIDTNNFFSTKVELGTGKGTVYDTNNFFKGSSGGTSGGSKGSSTTKPADFFETKSKNNQTLLQTLKPETKQKPIFKSYPIELGTSTKVITKTKPKLTQVQKIKTEVIPKTKVKQSAIVIPKPKVKQDITEEFFPKTIRTRTDFLNPPKPIKIQKTETTPITTTRQKASSRTAIGFFIPTPTQPTFMPPPTSPPIIGFRFFGGRGSGSGSRGLRRGNRINTAWNVDVNKVGAFFKGADFKQSFGDIAFTDLDIKTSKSAKRKVKSKNAVDDFFKL